MQSLLQAANMNLAICLIKLDNWNKLEVYLNEAMKGPSLKIKSKAFYFMAKYQIRKG